MLTGHDVAGKVRISEVVREGGHRRVQKSMT
jgi:hypothetical protein